MVLRAVGRAGWCCCGGCNFTGCDNNYPNSWSDIDSIGSGPPDWHQVGIDPIDSRYILDGRIYLKPDAIIEGTSEQLDIIRPAPLRPRLATPIRQVVTWTAHIEGTFDAPPGPHGHRVSSLAGDMGFFNRGIDGDTRPTISWRPRFQLASPFLITTKTTTTLEQGYEAGPLIETITEFGQCLERRQERYWFESDGELLQEITREHLMSQGYYDILCDGFPVAVRQFSGESSLDRWPDPYRISALSVVTT